MLHYIGYSFLTLAIFLSLFTRPIWSFLSVSFCLLALAFGYITNNFSIEGIYFSSHHNVPLIYKIPAIWTTNQGSMLLWVWVLCLYSFLFDLMVKKSQIKDVTIAVQSCVNSLFLLFVTYSANPFKKLLVVPQDGLGLNPILQDVALAIHPPVLYLGYVGLSICFSTAIAILLTENFEKQSFILLNHVLLIAFALLSFGVSLGCWWAYRELGWGGFWSWDPVENVSIMPWTLSLGAIHALFAARKYQNMQFLALFLSMTSFLSSILGTFITRSGIVDSLHTFANDREQGFYTLIILAILSFLSVAIFLFKFFKINTKEEGLNKNSWLMLSNSILSVALFFTLIAGTLLPFVFKLLFQKNIYISYYFYNSVFSQIFILLVVGILLFPAFSVKSFFSKYRFSIMASPLITIYAIQYSSGFLLTTLCFCGIFLSFAMIEHYLQSLPKISFYEILTTRKNPFFLSHLSLGIFLFGVATFFSLSSEVKQYFKPGGEIIIQDRKIVLEKYEIVEDKNFRGIAGVFRISGGKILKPEFRVYKKEGLANAESAILHRIFDDVYLVISGFDEKLGLATEIYYRRGIQIIWLSFAILILGCVAKIINRPRLVKSI